MRFSFHEAVAPAASDPLIALFIREGAFAEADEVESMHEAGCHRTRHVHSDQDPVVPDMLGASPAELAEINFSYTF
jgi:hypothetical protein